MLRTYLYVPDWLNKRISQAAEARRTSKAEVMREALEKGIDLLERQGAASAEVLLKLADIGKVSHMSGPRDSSKRIDELLWGKDWSQDE